jgi:hypothetical protein
MMGSLFRESPAQAADGESALPEGSGVGERVPLLPPLFDPVPSTSSCRCAGIYRGDGEGEDRESRFDSAGARVDVGCGNGRIGEGEPRGRRWY